MEYHFNSNTLVWDMVVTCPICKVESAVISSRVLPYVVGDYLQCPLVLCDICYRDKQIDVCIDQ